MKKLNRSFLSETDRKILFFIWQWKFSTTAAIRERFYPEWKLMSVYDRLLDVARMGFLERRYIEKGFPGIVWTLSQNGFKAIKNRIPPMKDVGFCSENIRHDFLTNAFHLGELLVDRNPNVKFVTEQELRRIDEEFLPSWVPSPRFHRPDGYWGISHGNQISIVSLEVELERQNLSVTMAKANFYMDFHSIKMVVWLVADPTIHRNLQNTFKRIADFEYERHHFVLLEDFLFNGWSASFVSGKHAGCKIHDLIKNEDTNMTPTAHQHVGVLSLLDSRACPRNRREIPSLHVSRKMRMTPMSGQLNKE